MSERVPTPEPLEYDPKRLSSFLRRALSKGNLPSEYKPHPGVNREAFADAIIGSYLDGFEDALRSAEQEGDVEVIDETEQEYDQGLTRADFAIRFLQGVQAPYLRTCEKNNEVLKKEGYRDYALTVAGKGAKNFRLSKEQLTQNLSTVSREQKNGFTVLIDYADLDDFIRKLYQQKRMSYSLAQSLLFYFGLRDSDKSDEAKDAGRTFARVELYYKLKQSTMSQKLFSENGYKDPRIDLGAKFIKKNIGNPMRHEPGQPLDAIITQEMFYSGSDDRQAASEHVMSHIGFVLDTLFDPTVEVY
jgi:hypothetical protein